MEAYKRWVRSNKDYVHSLESLANGLTWFLPERFSDSEIAPEAVTTFLGIITALNEHIIDTTPIPNRKGSQEGHSFPYALCISALKDLETLVEVVAQYYYGDDKKWNFLAVTEATKVLVRLALFQNSGYKMLLHGGETPNIEESSDNINSQQSFGGLAKPGGQNGHAYLRNNLGHNPWNVQGGALSALSKFGENARMVPAPVWLQRVHHQNAIMGPPAQVVERPTLFELLSNKGVSGALFVMGEVFFITRPLIYVLLIRKYGIRSWIPWFVSLAVDLSGISASSLLKKSSHGGKEQGFQFSTSEKDELKRRKLLWALYLMRDPFFSKYSRQRLESTGKLLEPVPVIGLLIEKLVELIVGAQTRYTYMSGS